MPIGRQGGRSGSRSGQSGRRGYRPGGGSRFGGAARRPRKKRSCAITAEKRGPIDYKEVEFLSRYVSDRGKISPRSYTKGCAKKQRELARAIRKARAIGFMKVGK